MRSFSILFFALLLVSVIFPDAGLFADTSRLTIIHSSNTNGYVLPCPT